MPRPPPSKVTLPEGSAVSARVSSICSRSSGPQGTWGLVQRHGWLSQRGMRLGACAKRPGMLCGPMLTGSPHHREPSHPEQREWQAKVPLQHFPARWGPRGGQRGPSSGDQAISPGHPLV